MEILSGFISIFAGYLIGSFPTAYLITKWLKGVDIRDIDVGNMGAAAVRRQLGVIPGISVAFLDIAKGALTIFIAQQLVASSDIFIYASGFAALLGHCYPVYIGFRGGQGTATVIGIFAMLSPLVLAIMLVIMAVFLLIFRRVFPMTITSGIFLPVLLWFVGHSPALTIYSLVIIIFMSARNYRGIYREVCNLKRKLLK